MLSAAPQLKAPSHSLSEANSVLAGVVAAGAPTVSSSGQACDLIGEVERARRLAAVVAVDALEQIQSSRSFYEQGHKDARTMFAHVAGVSGAEAYRLDKIRRMVSEADQIAGEWRGGRLSVDKAALLGMAFANPRCRDRFLVDQKMFIKRARRFGFVRFKKIVARWIEVNDDSGSEPDADPTHERRSLSLVQDHFSKAWKLEATLGSLAGSELNEILGAYCEAEFAHDWAAAEAVHGPEVCVDALARTAAQRRVDALCQIAADAVNSAKPSAPVKRVHNIVWNAETYEELLRRWVDGPSRILDADSYQITDIDGHPLCAAATFADSLTSSVRRVVQNAAGVTINMSAETRFFAGLARLGVALTTTECYWPGCHVPTSGCQMDHLRPAARGGLTEQVNGLPACKRHNRFKERGYTVTRDPNGTITITTPTGDTVQ